MGAPVDSKEASAPSPVSGASSSGHKASWGSGHGQRRRGLQDALLQEWADFSQSLDDRLQDHFRNQELLMNLQAIRFEGIVAAQVATRRPSRTNSSGQDAASDPEVVHVELGQVPAAVDGMAAPAVLQVCSSVREAETQTSCQRAGVSRASSPEANPDPWVDTKTQLKAESVAPTDTSFLTSSQGTSAVRLRLRPEKEVDRLVDELIGRKRIDSIFGNCFDCLERWVDWWLDLEEPQRQGRLATFVDSRLFESICGVVIGLNTMVTVRTTNFEAQSLSEDKSKIMKLISALFLVFYCVELLLKISVHKLFFFCNNEMWWNIFDLVLVTTSVIDKAVATMSSSDSVNISHMRTMRIVRLAKILRMVRMMRFFQELRLMLTSLVGSLVSLFWSIVMLSLVFFIFSLIFVQGATITLMNEDNGLSPEEESQLQWRLGNIQSGMLGLYQTTTGGEDWTHFYRSIQQTGGLNSTLFLFFVAFSQFALLNILTGMYVENAMKLAQPDREKLAVTKRKAEISEADELRRLFRSMDAQKTGFICEEQFMRQLKNHHFKARLSLLGLDIKDAELFFKIISSDFNHHEVAIEAFVSGAMRLKGHASSLDLQTLTFGTKLIHSTQLQFQQSLEKRLDAIETALEWHEVQAPSG